MSFTSHIPRAPIFKPTEGSRLAPMRDRNGLAQSWKPQREINSRVDKVVGTVSQLRSQVQRLSGQRPPPSGMHPFKIYQFPRYLRLHKNDDDWRRVKVRNGEIVLDGNNSTTGGFGSARAYGSDYINPAFYSGGYDQEIYLGDGSQVLPTDGSAVVPGVAGYDTLGWNEFIVPNDGNEYDIWFTFFCESAIGDLGGPSMGILAQSNLDTGKAFSLATGETIDINYTTTAGYQVGPYYGCVSDPYNIKIGSVKAENGVLTINQTLYGNAFWKNPFAAHTTYQNSVSPGAGVTPRFCGQWCGINEYFIGDLVTTIEATADPSGGLGSYNRMGWLSQFIYLPDKVNNVFTSAYDPAVLMGPMHGIGPLTHTPDPWVLLSRSPISLNSNPDPLVTGDDWINGAYDATKFYVRKS